MNTEEVAARLNLTVGRVRQLAIAGQLPGQRVGRDWVFLSEDVETFAARPRRRGRPPRDEDEGDTPHPP